MNRPIDSFQHIAPFAMDYRARPEVIYANGFD